MSRRLGLSGPWCRAGGGSAGAGQTRPACLLTSASWLHHPSRFGRRSLDLPPPPVRAQRACCKHQARLEETFWLVRGVSMERRYETWEARRHRRDAAVFFVIWLCSVTATALDDVFRAGSCDGQVQPNSVGLGREALCGSFSSRRFLGRARRNRSWIFQLLFPLCFLALGGLSLGCVKQLRIASAATPHLNACRG